MRYNYKTIVPSATDRAIFMLQSTFRALACKLWGIAVATRRAMEILFMYPGYPKTHMSERLTRACISRMSVLFMGFAQYYRYAP